MLHIREPRTLRRPERGTGLSITDITADAVRLAAYDGHERIWFGRDEARGLTAIVAIHNTALGPALGGTRVWPHASFEAALTDALRLSRGMTYKAAVAGLPFGGGKAVIIADPKTDKTRPLLEAYAQMLAGLEGQFFTGEDVGLTLADADFLRRLTTNVTGTSEGGSGDPSPVTARGVFLGIRAALAHRTGSDDISGVRVAVQGLGSVGRVLCGMLSEAGARLVVTDIDPARVEKAQAAFGAEAVAVNDFLAAETDVFAPCALGGIISVATIPALKARIVAGSANNQLAEHTDARRLMERGVLYAPDYVINAGGLINVAAELAPGGYDRADVMARVEKIPAVLADIFARSRDETRPTNDITAQIAREHIAAAERR